MKLKSKGLAIVAGMSLVGLTPKVSDARFVRAFSSKTMVSGPMIVAPVLPRISSVNLFSSIRLTSNLPVISLPTIRGLPKVAISPARVMPTAAFSSSFDGGHNHGGYDFEDLIREVREAAQERARKANTNRFRGGLGQGVRPPTPQESSIMKAKLKENGVLETPDYKITVKGLDCTSETEGKVLVKIINKHTNQEYEIKIAAGSSTRFAVTDRTNNLYKIFSIKAISINQFIGEAEMEVKLVGVVDIKPKIKQKQEPRTGLILGNFIEKGELTVQLIDIENGYAVFHAASGEQEWEFSLRPGQNKDLTVIHEDNGGYFKVFKLKMNDFGIDLEGNRIVFVTLTE